MQFQNHFPIYLVTNNIHSYIFNTCWRLILYKIQLEFAIVSYRTSTTLRWTPIVHILFFLYLQWKTYFTLVFYIFFSFQTIIRLQFFENGHQYMKSYLFHSSNTVIRQTTFVQNIFSIHFNNRRRFGWFTTFIFKSTYCKIIEDCIFKYCLQHASIVTGLHFVDCVKS